MDYINMHPDRKKGQTVTKISSQLDTIFPTVDISIFVESESEHPG